MAKLYIVGTPIGNLGDFSPRAAETLQFVDFIAAEDTRVTVKILNHFNIKKPMISYHEHNVKEKSEYIAGRIIAGENAAIVTDAGMPCISDPGEELVRVCHLRGVQVVVVPGPSAVVAAVAASGLITGRFTFEGFVAVNKNGRRQHLEKLKNEERTMVFYEAPHKLRGTLKDFLENFGERKLVICRELTKKFEEIIVTTTSEAVEIFAQRPPQGEFVLVLAGLEKPPETEKIEFADAVNMLAELIKNGEKINLAAKNIALLTGYKKTDLYKAALQQTEGEN